MTMTPFNKYTLESLFTTQPQLSIKIHQITPVHTTISYFVSAKFQKCHYSKQMLPVEPVILTSKHHPEETVPK